MSYLIFLHLLQFTKIRLVTTEIHFLIQIVVAVSSESCGFFAGRGTASFLKDASSVAPASTARALVRPWANAARTCDGTQRVIAAGKITAGDGPAPSRGAYGNCAPQMVM